MTEQSTTNEIATIESAAAPVAGLSNELANLGAGRLSVYSSITGTDFKSRVAVIKALTNATPIADNIGKTFLLQNVVIQNITMTNERTGELQEVPRITFIDSDGSAFHAISDVLYKDLKNVFAILGQPSQWPAPLLVKVEKIQGKAGKFFTLTVEDEPVKK